MSATGAAATRSAPDFRRLGGGAAGDSERRLLSYAAEFVEVLLHQLLQRHRVYPSGAFEMRQRYGLPVWQCTHPRVAEYTAAVASTFEMCAGAVDRLRVIFRHGGESRPIHYCLLVRLRPERFEDCADACLRLEAQLARLLLAALGPPLPWEAGGEQEAETQWSVEFVSKRPLEGLASPHFPIGRVGGEGGGGRLEPMGSAVAPFLGLDLAMEELPAEDGETPADWGMRN